MEKKLAPPVTTAILVGEGAVKFARGLEPTGIIAAAFDMAPTFANAVRVVAPPYYSANSETWRRLLNALAIPANVNVRDDVGAYLGFEGVEIFPNDQTKKTDG